MALMTQIETALSSNVYPRACSALIVSTDIDFHLDTICFVTLNKTIEYLMGNLLYFL
jgi:hypothetical protein